MKCTTIILVLLPTLLAAQPFEFVQELDSIPVVVDGDTLPAAWIGGYEDVCPRGGDLDGDGHLDLLIGWSNGTIDRWQNVGSPYEATFELQERVFMALDFGAYAQLALWDMDSDGDPDVLARGSYPMMVIENVGSPTNPLFEVFEDSLRDNEGNFIYGHAFDTADIDADGDEDLFVGQFNASGIKFYQNIGDSTQYDFFIITSNFAGISAGWYASPFFCDIDADGDLDLFIGTADGKMLYYRNDGTPQQYNYTFVTNQWMGINVDETAIPDFSDLDSDGDYDLLVGKENDYTYTMPGALHFWRNNGTALIPQMMLESQMYLTLDFGIVSAPSVLDVNFDDKGDPFVHSYYIAWLKDVGAIPTPLLELQNYSVAGTGFLASTVGYGDLNGDGHEDMVVVYGWSGDVRFWFNNGDTLNPQFYYISGFGIGQLAGGPVLEDMDGDGDNDLIMGVSSLQFEDFIYYYENQGDPQHFDFVLTTTNYQSWAGDYRIASIVDFDGDADFDVIAKVDTANIMTYFENIGTPQNANFAPPYNNFISLDEIAACDFCDVDHDGDMDAFFGSYYGGLRFFRNITGEVSAPPPVERHPQAGLQISLGPNPANPNTVISFSLPLAQQIDLAVYNLLGARVTTLASGPKLPGSYVIPWDASGNASGIYIIRLKTPQQSLSEKLTIIK